MLQQNKIIQLKRYAWTGINHEGNAVSGEIEALTLVLAKAKLIQQGMVVKKITRSSRAIFSGLRKIKNADMTLLGRQLAGMLQSGIPLLQALNMIANSQTNSRLRFLIVHIMQDLESGKTLSESLKAHPAYFNELYCNLVEAGEASGCLGVMLMNINIYREKIESLKRKVKKAAFYPAIVTAIGVMISLFLLIVVTPQFEALFKGFGATLPLFTKMVMRLSEVIQTDWQLSFSFLSLLIFLVLFFYKRTFFMKAFIERFLLKFLLIRQVIISRVIRTLAITCEAGLPLCDALKLAAGAAGNLPYSTAIHQIRSEVSRGEALYKAMAHTHWFPDRVIQMVRIGEESGMLIPMLTKIADFHDQEVDAKFDTLSTLIEPVMIALLGMLVGSFVVAMYLPIFKLGTIV